jgi:hypothetical protein
MHSALIILRPLLVFVKLVCKIKHLRNMHAWNFSKLFWPEHKMKVLNNLLLILLYNIILYFVEVLFC